MSYTRFYPTWHEYPDTTTPVRGAFLQALEDFLVTVTPGIAPPAAPATNDALVWSGTAWTNAKITNANVDPAAAIAYSKLLLTASVVNGDISASAAIAYSKLNLAASVTNTDIATAAAIAYSKLSLAGSIVNADIATSAAVAISKLAGYPSDSTKFLAGDGTWAVPTSSGAMTLICDSLLGASQASFDTNTILSGNFATTFKHLQIVFSGRGDTAAGSTSVSMRVNNDAGANYENANAFMNGASTFSGTGTGGGSNAAVLGHMTAASAVAGATGSFNLIISNYAASTLWRRWSGTASADDGTNIWVEMLGGAWRNTAAAINRISLTPAAGNFVAGTRFTLYGLS